MCDKCTCTCTCRLIIAVQSNGSVHISVCLFSLLSLQENDASAFDANQVDFNQVDSVLDMIRNLIPDNIVTVCTQLYSTDVTLVNVSLGDGNSTQIERLGNKPVESVNVLGM